MEAKMDHNWQRSRHSETAVAIGCAELKQWKRRYMDHIWQSDETFSI